MSRAPVKISRLQFIYLYMDEKRSGLEIARFFGIGRTTVSRYIDKFGLPRRSNQDIWDIKKAKSRQMVTDKVL